ncbi:uncharacterized protein PFL1_00921 [Pseudozyma flocculosa PF-1]|uniref:Related to Delta-12 fatty acid desaturase n=1 Tax=Pseudozyma flocculosa TaxID=84751 RepID=A0A5C3FB56_9BASI|nr:uncharacterized protein PFL1_00921 [Pseudozyma flocculosa PF-1]EPQ31588.1 hypothetical protein PFL1_00921 [Pseudozyma flocculosa PF-1]SPO40701.1 related to Delta-12 fatty acid desaturase [Pseudozyma flocculosa]
MSTAAAPNVTAATQRAGKAAPVAAGSNEAAKPTKYSHKQAQPYNEDELAKFNVPSFTVKDLLSAIPAHCFERSAFKSFTYVFYDLAMVAALGYAATYIDPSVGSYFSQNKANALTPYLSLGVQQNLARFALWSVYWVLQGLVFTGLWVIAHECGHQSFSTSKTLNNAVGWVLHSALLVPYHSWRISHARHHAATGHLTRDEVFVPRTRSQKGLLPLKPAAKAGSDAGEDEEVVSEEETWGEWLKETLEDAPAYNLFYIFIQQLFGWPLYLIQNASGQLHYPKFTNHFNPEAIIFDKRHRSQILISDLGIACTLAAMAFGASVAPRGFTDVFRYYLIPYLWCNHWLVMITYLQHTDPMLPHYKAETWTFPRGALCTIDRQWLGPVGPYLLHGISETHVLHHVSSKIPHYHAWEATEALKARLGEHYAKSTENVFVSLWKSIRECKYIEESDQVAFYRNGKGVPKRTVSPDSGYNSDSAIAMSE